MAKTTAYFPFLALFVVGCAGHVSYVSPSAQIALGTHAKIIDKHRDIVWNDAIPELGKRFFVINTLDKASGLINISYSGDPEAYIDCGRITSFVKNAQGERTYDFPGAKAQQNYEVMQPGIGLFFLDRRMSLDGRVNIIFEQMSENQTRVTVNTKYVISRVSHVRKVTEQGSGQTFNDTASMNTNGRTTLGGGDSVLECIATGSLEDEVLRALH